MSTRRPGGAGARILHARLWCVVRQFSRSVVGQQPGPSLSFRVLWVDWAQVGCTVFWGGVVRGLDLGFWLLGGLLIGDFALGFRLDRMRVADAGGAGVGRVDRGY